MKVKVAAVQMRFGLASSRREFEDKIELFVKKAKKESCSLVAFPEDCGTLLLGLGLRSPISLIKSYLQKKEGIFNLIKRAAGCLVTPKNIFALLGPHSQEIFEEVFSTLSKKYNIYIMAGSILLPENNNVYNVGYFYDDDGNLLGKQKKLHLYPTEIFWGITPGDDIQVFGTSFGRVGISICMDTGYPEMGRIQRLKGADLVIDASANPDYYYEVATLHGLWARVQENLFYGIHSVMVGDIFGKIVLRGKAKILAPCYLTQDITGFISVARSDNRDELVVGEIDFEKLYKFRQDFDNVEIINTDLIKKYLPLYEGIPRVPRKSNWLTALRGLTLKR